jgi:hypothetical protein
VGMHTILTADLRLQLAALRNLANAEGEFDC